MPRIPSMRTHRRSLRLPCTFGLCVASLLLIRLLFCFVFVVRLLIVRPGWFLLVLPCFAFSGLLLFSGLFAFLFLLGFALFGFVRVLFRLFVLSFMACVVCVLLCSLLVFAYVFTSIALMSVILM